MVFAVILCFFSLPVCAFSQAACSPPASCLDSSTGHSQLPSRTNTDIAQTKVKTSQQKTQEGQIDD